MCCDNIEISYYSFFITFAYCIGDKIRDRMNATFGSRHWINSSVKKIRIIFSEILIFFRDLQFSQRGYKLHKLHDKLPLIISIIEGYQKV